MTYPSLQLRSDNPSIAVNFRLDPGSRVLVGASPKADISLPFPGIADVSLVIGKSGNGLLYVSQPDGSGVRYIEPPAIVPVAPYHFVITESASSPVTTPPPARRRRTANKQSAWQIIAGSVAALLFLGFVFAELRRPAQSDAKPAAPAPREHLVASVETTQEPAPLPLAPVPTLAPEPPQAVAETTVSPPSPEVSKRVDFEEIGERAAAAVLTIEVLDESKGKILSNGTAFAISADGLAVTNFHVIEKIPARLLRARTTEGERIPVVRIVAVNPKSDLALISLVKSPPGFLEIGDSREIKVGAPVAIFGTPDGLSGTLSEGIVSAKRRSSELGEDSLDPDVELIQMTAPMSPGSSGSPVMDRHGKVVGVATMIQVGPALQNLNFAIASTAVKKLREDAAKGLASVTPSIATPYPKPTAPNKPPTDILFESPLLNDEILADYNRYAEKKDYPNALSSAIRLVAKYPRAALPHTLHGAALLWVDLPEAAEKALTTAIKLNGTDSSSWFLLGISQRQQEKYSEARRTFKRAVELKPSYAEAWEEIATLSIALDDATDAISSLQRVRDLNPALFKEWLTWHANRKEPSLGLKTLLSHFGVQSSSESSTQSEFHDIVIRLIANYLASQEQADPLAELSHFSEVVNPYYEKGRRSKSEILPHIQAFRSQWPQRSFEFVRLEHADFMNGFNLEVTYVVRFTTTKGSNKRSGLMRQTLHFTEDSNRRWRISAIKTHSN